jgi:hypothetical protein
MSFDVFLQRFKGGEPAEADRVSVLEVLRAEKHTEFDQFGFSIVTFHDGIDVEFSASGLESNDSFTGCAFHVRGFGEALVKFMFDVARAGDMVILPAMEGAPVGLVSDAQQCESPLEMQSDFRLARLQSAHDLGLLLKDGFEAWSNYREAIQRKADPDSSAPIL